MTLFLANLVGALVGAGLGYAVMWYRHQRYRSEKRAILEGLQRVQALPPAALTDQTRVDVIRALIGLLAPADLTRAQIRDGVSSIVLNALHATESEITAAFDATHNAATHGPVAKHAPEWTGPGTPNACKVCGKFTHAPGTSHPFIPATPTDA